jgi:hypothetical protein
MATKTAVIVLCEEAGLIWAIPLLSPQPPDFFDHNPTHILPLLIIPFPDGLLRHPGFFIWKTTSSWYFGSSHHLYFDMTYRDRKLQRFQIMLKPDLSTASLHVINTFEVAPHDFQYILLEDYRICEDAIVCCRIYDNRLPPYQSGPGVYANIISYGGPAAKMLLPDIGHNYRLFSCPALASGRFVLLVHDGGDNTSVAVLDLF